jgi:hypothetical protein
MPDKFGNWLPEELFAAGIPQLQPKPDQNALAQPGVGLPIGWGTAAGMAGGIVGTAVGNPLLSGLVDAAMLPGDVYLGRVDPNSPEGFARAQNMAGVVVGGGIPMAEAGALGIGGGRIGATRLAPEVSGGVGQGVRLAEEYVPNAPPVMTTDPRTGNVYPKKTLS